MTTNQPQANQLSYPPSSRLLSKGDIPQSTRQSLMSMMKEIMQKSYLYSDELHYIAEESVQESINLERDDIQANNNRYQEDLLVKQQEKIESEQLMYEKYIRGSSLTLTNTNDHIKSSTTSHQHPTNNNNNNSTTSSRQLLSPHHQPSSSSQSTTHEFTKLIEITQRCVNYYNTFLLQKSSQLQIIQKTFIDLNNNLNLAFQQMVKELVKKQNQLKEFLNKKYWDIVTLREQQDMGLKIALNQIKQVHLTKLTTMGNKMTTMGNKMTTVGNKMTTVGNNMTTVGNKSEERNQFIGLINHNNYHNSSKTSPSSQVNKTLTNSPILHQDMQKSSQLSIQLHNYASTLNHFYTLMQQIQKSNFRQMVQESVNFINNLITEEIKVTLYENIPVRLTEKRMIRENSKDFLLESVDNSIEGKSDTFGILDVQSFTKLFCQVDQKLEAYRSDKVSGNNGEISVENTKSEKDKSLAIFDVISARKTSLVQTKLNPQDKLIKSSDYKDSMQINRQTQINSNVMKKSLPQKASYQNHSSPQCVQTNIRQNSTTSKPNFNKKLTNQAQSFSPLKNTQKSYQNSEKQNELQLIKKISNQQSNRSAKIKGYLVTFQDSKLNSIQTNHNKKPQTTRRTNNSKSPIKKQKTPPKLSKSAQKKPLTSSVVINGSNQQKLKSSQQQTSLKTSRNSTYVSQFKIPSSRRQSLANNK